MAQNPASPLHPGAPGASTVTFQSNWYFYKDGKVSGPSSIDKIMGFGAKDAKGQRILVSKVGFEKWYPIDDLSELFDAQKSMELENALEIEQLKRFLADNARRLASTAANAQPQDRKVKKKTIDASVRKAAAAPAPRAAERMAPEARMPAAQAAPAAQAPVEAATPAPSTRARANRAAKTLNELYLQIRGTQRLGRFRNAPVTAFVMFPLTLGFGWVVWLRQTLFEMLWHATGETELKGRLPNPWLALVPGLHMYFAYKLAVLIRFAETQDGYRSTNPNFALAMAVVPPFAMMYLQDQVNAHWRFHTMKEWQKHLSAEAS